MSEKEKHLEDLSEIRNLMERSSKFISLSGMSGVSAGLIAMVGACIAFWYINIYFHHNTKSLIFKSLDLNTEIVVFLFSLAVIVLSLALLSGFYFTYRRAKLKGNTIWSKSAFRVAYNLLIPLVSGGLLVIILFYFHQVNIISGITLIFYGLALVNASHFTLNDIKFLGILEILLGLLACVFQGYGIFFWATGFGILHIIYGIIMYYKYERN